jgi:serine/threonine-protein kinase RsbW
MTSGNTVRVDFHSSLEMLDLIQLVSDHIGRRAGLDEEALHWVGVALRESVINAIKHGNCSDVRKRVHVEFTVLQGDAVPGLAIRVRDEGCGFDPSTIADPLAQENLLKSTGRGILMMRSFMDEMTFQRTEEGGMEVRMLKRRDNAECRIAND